MAGAGALEKKITEKEAGDVRALAIATEAKIAAVASLMEAAGKTTQMAVGAPYASQITAESKGVPQGADIEKRQVAQSVLSSSQDVEAVVFILPNGEVYI